MTVRNYFLEKIPTITKSFYEYFIETIKQFGNKIALNDPETTKFVTYSKLANRSEQMLNALMRIGIQHGDVIGTYVSNSSDFVTFVLAAIGLGAVLVPLNPTYKTYEIEKYFKKASVKWILTEERLFERIRHLEMGSMQAIIFFSSGTTGLPKGILLNHSALIANVELVRKAQGMKCAKYEMVGLSGMDVVYGVLPYFHAGGLLTVFGLLGLGAQILVNRKFDSEQFVTTLSNYQAGISFFLPILISLAKKEHMIERFESVEFLFSSCLINSIVINKKLRSNFNFHIYQTTVTTALLVPPVLKFLAVTPNLNPEAFHSLKQIFVGSAHVNESLIETVKHLYGTTEAGAFVFMQPLYSEGKNASCGILLPNVECKIMKLSSNEECEEMEIGEIWLKTATMMQGYLDRTVHTDGTFVDGWFRTGDLGYCDLDQFIYITGRIKDMIKVRGWQVSPYEIEEAIHELKGVQSCAVIGIPDEYSGQLPKAYIQLRDGCQMDENTIHQLMKSKFASYKQLKGGIQFISNMPVNSAGKISRMDLLKMNEVKV
uniref:AMP-binding domain-containing protein n=1 Tax=Elaeophora elaphi TaxID=1147741 RepID=A0A158Q880_9BILA